MDGADRAGGARTPRRDPWPYGIAPNRMTLEAFLQYAFEQGVCHRPLTPEALFPREVAERFKV